MKFLIIRKFLWLVLFTLVHLWFMAFNWQIFITMLNVNLGFAVVRMPPFVVLFLTGFLILAIHSWTGYVNKLHRIIHNLEEELSRRNKDRQPLRSNGLGEDKVTRSRASSRVDNEPEDPVEKGERKEEGTRSDIDPKN